MGPPPLQLQGHTGAQVPACVLVFGGGVVLPGPLACPSGRGGITKAGVGGEEPGGSWERVWERGPSGSWPARLRAGHEEVAVGRGAMTSGLGGLEGPDAAETSRPELEGKQGCGLGPQQAGMGVSDELGLVLRAGSRKAQRLPETGLLRGALCRGAGRGDSASELQRIET